MTPNTTLSIGFCLCNGSTQRPMHNFKLWPANRAAMLPHAGTLAGPIVAHLEPSCGPPVALLWPSCGPLVAYCGLLWPSCGSLVAFLWPACGLLVALLWPSCGRKRNTLGAHEKGRNKATKKQRPSHGTKATIDTSASVQLNGRVQNIFIPKQT